MELHRSTPEAQGLRSAAVIALVDRLEREGLEPHSLMVLRNGHVVAEAWWSPYHSDGLQQLYSLSKPFVSVAAGLAIGEGLLDLDERLVDAFPETASVAGPRASSLTMHHALSMSTGHRSDSLPAIADRAGTPMAASPAHGFLGYEPEEAPGSWFAYDNGASIAAGTLIQRRTGQRLVDYLRPRLFDPLGIERAAWQQLPDGYDVGFSGLFLTTESIARFGMLVLADGVWDGRRLIPVGWLARATAKQVVPADHERGPDWQQGYGYQFWRCRHGAIRGDGAYGQFCIVLPDQQAVVVLTSSAEAMERCLDAVWEELLPALGPARLPADPEADSALRDRLAAASLPVRRSTHRPLAGPTWAFTGPDGPNSSVVRGLALSPAQDGWQLTIDDRGIALSVYCGDGHWPVGATAYAATGGWSSPTVFEATVVAVQTPHSLVLRADTTTGCVVASWTWENSPWCWRTLADLTAPRS